jgi:hypothetical protein
MALERVASPPLARRLFGGTAEGALALLRAAWPAAVGPDVARRTEVLALGSGVLRIRVPDARWRKELHRMQPEIMRRLRAAAGDLAPRQLGFIEMAAAEEPAREAEPASVPAPPLAAAVVAGAAAIDDDELRARFLESAARYLARTQRG